MQGGAQPPGYGDVAEIVETTASLRRRSAYDAAYLVLARRLDARLFTLDGSLSRNAGERGSRSSSSGSR